MFEGLESPLVEKLASGDNEVRVCARSEPEARREDLIRSIGYDLVHVTFPNTRGGTELGIHLKRELCDDLDISEEPTAGPKSLRIVGDLTLDWVPIRVTVDFSLETFEGIAIVEKREEVSANNSS